MDEQRFVISDDVWGRLRPLLPGKPGDSGATGKDNRLFLEAVLWRVRTGLPWRDLPKAFGNWTACSGVSEDGLKPEFSSVFSKR